MLSKAGEQLQLSSWLGQASLYLYHSHCSPGESPTDKGMDLTESCKCGKTNFNEGNWEMYRSVNIFKDENWIYTL